MNSTIVDGLSDAYTIATIRSDLYRLALYKARGQVGSVFPLMGWLRDVRLSKAKYKALTGTGFDCPELNEVN